MSAGTGARGVVAATHAVTLPAAAAGDRFDAALARALPQYSRSRLRAWIDAGRVTLDGEPATATHRVRGGERVVVASEPDPREAAFAPEAIALSVVFEDDALIVVDKPAGLVVHPGSGNWAGTLANALVHHAPQLAAVPRAGIVHRLDKDTSGLLVIAKTLAAQTALVRQMQARSVTREYVALAAGDIASAGVVDAPIGRHPTRRTTMAVVATGKAARTHFDVVERFGVATLLSCRLETGRTHQIRVHLASLGHPLVGDPTYGRKGAIAFARQALHAARLALVHPVTGHTCRWESPLPRDFDTLLASLRSRRRR
ncbi:MAG TPA: 23S rRNA pseudouridine(1911/1915/1917) synthase RluD [Casimicrobiaceae bacterium]|nr:23S rRNA pseudouridine(1911/1915/1917) synthase RluD [Casimicrobiaceae bacterium]